MIRTRNIHPHEPFMRFLLATIVGATALACHPTAAQQYAEFETALLTAVHDTVVAAEAPGIVRTVLVDAGAYVTESALLVELNKQIYEAELRVAKAEKRVAEIEAANDVNVQYARKTFEVSQKLLDRSERARQQFDRSITQSELDRLQLELEQSRLAERQARLQLEIANETTKQKAEQVEVARLRLENRSIRAPFGGRVEQIFVQPGQWIDAGTPIARIVDMNSLRIKAIFSIENYLKINMGNSARFTYRIGEQEFAVAGRVTFRNAVVSDNVFQVWVDMENSELTHVPGVQGRLRVELN